MNLTMEPVALGPGAFFPSATPSHIPGQRGVDRLGRRYRYVRAGAVALVAGDVMQAAPQITAHTTAAVAAAAIGATSVVVTLGAVAAAENLYRNGLLIVDTTPGEGYSYAIDYHAAVLASGALTAKLSKDTPIQVALTTSSKVTLVRNLYDGVIQTPVTTLTGVAVGVAVYPIPISYYGWIGTGGIFSTLVKGTPGVGLAVVVPGTAAGAVVIDGAAAATQVVGAMAVTGADALRLPVFVDFP